MQKIRICSLIGLGVFRPIREQIRFSQQPKINNNNNNRALIRWGLRLNGATHESAIFLDWAFFDMTTRYGAVQHSTAQYRVYNQNLCANAILISKLPPLKESHPVASRSQLPSMDTDPRRRTIETTVVYVVQQPPVITFSSPKTLSLGDGVREGGGRCILRTTNHNKNSTYKMNAVHNLVSPGVVFGGGVEYSSRGVILCELR